MVSANRNKLATVSNNVQRAPTTPGTKVRQLTEKLETKENENENLRAELAVLTKALGKVDLLKPEIAGADNNEPNEKKGKKKVPVVPAKTAYKFFCENAPKQENMQQVWKETDPDVRQNYFELAKADKARYEKEMEAYNNEQRALELYREKKKQEQAMAFYEAHQEAQAALKKAEEESTVGKKKKRAPKDPNAPKRNMSAYMFFAQAKRPGVVAENPKVPVTEIAKILGEMWNKLENTKQGMNDKKKFEQMATKDKVRYEEEKAEYDSKMLVQKEAEAREKEARLEQEKKEAMELLAIQVPSVIGGGEDVSVMTDESGAKQGRKKKDPNAPKKNLSAYNFFMKENRESIKNKMGADVKNAELLTEIGKQWKELTATKKTKYEKMAAKDKTRYEKEMEAYNKGKALASAN